MDGLQVWIKVFILAWGSVCFGAATSMITSISFAQVGLFRGDSRYAFSHIISMASFLAFMSSRFSPPSSVGRYSVFSAILGFVLSCQMKSRVIFVKASSILFGIPCAWVRNWVSPPIVIWMIIFLLSRVG